MSSAKNIHNNEYIDVIAIVKKVWAYKFMILALGLVAMIAMAVKVQFLTKDTYVASGILYVSNRSMDDESTVVSKNDIDSSQLLTTTYMEVLKTRSFLTDVSKDIGEKYSWSRIGKMVSYSAVNGTQLMKISVTAYSPNDAYIIADSIVREALDKLNSIFKNGDIELVDSVAVPTAPVDKKLIENTAMGAMVGLFIGVFIAVLMSFFDTKVHRSEDVARRYNVSVLGDIAQ